MISVEPYTQADAAQWNQFVATSRNGTFLLDRNYMEYHRDRFHDASLMLRDSSRLLALLPANRNGDMVASHGGLTYGGFIVDDRMTAALMLEVFRVTIDHLARNGIRRVVYKTIPAIYHRTPTMEDLYALFRLDARLTRRDVLSVIDNANPLPFQTRRQRGAKKANAGGLVVSEDEDWQGFWDLLAGRLGEKYQTRPVHTVEEIRLLASRFPENIRLFTCRSTDSIMAGVVVYDTGRVAHAQYIAASEDGRQSGAQDLLFDRLIARYAGRRWFDFGISNEQNGRVLNNGLIAYKEGFGARAIVQDFYEIETDASRF